MNKTEEFEYFNERILPLSMMGFRSNDTIRMMFITDDVDVTAKMAHKYFDMVAEYINVDIIAEGYSVILKKHPDGIHYEVYDVDGLVFKYIVYIVKKGKSGKARVQLVSVVNSYWEMRLAI